MRTEMAYVEGEFTPGGSFEARCVDCGEEFGTFTLAGIRNAIVRNINRGGVKCPGCRARSCFFCGVRREKGWYGLRWINPAGKRTTPEYRPVCPLCAIEQENLLEEEKPPF